MHNGSFLKPQSRNWLGPDHDRIITVLDIGTSKICCVIARFIPPLDGMGEDAVLSGLKILSVNVHRSSGIKGGFIVDMNAVEQAVRACVSGAEARVGLTVDEVILSVACGRLKSVNFTVSDKISGRAVETRDINSVLLAGQDYAAGDSRVVIHMIPVSFSIDESDGIRDPLGMTGERLSADIHAVTAEEQALKNLIQVVDRCHLSISSLVAAPYASGMATVVRDEAKLGVTAIDIGGGTTTLSVFADGHFVFSDILALGGDNITRDIARALSCPIQDAERIKTLYGSVVTAASDESELITVSRMGESGQHSNQLTRAQLGLIIKPRMEEILVMLGERLNKSGFAPYAGQIVVLTGGASLLPGIAGLASRILGKSVRIGAPKKIFTHRDQPFGPELSTAIGLLTYPFRPNVQINVIENQRFLNTGTGYLSRMGNWLRESF